jgi:hypothetical protein
VLLSKGIPWEVIETLTTEDVHIILGVEAALKTKEQEDTDAQMRVAGAKSR